MKNAFLALTTLLLASPALADTVTVDDAWVRATAPGQKVAGAFMNLTADTEMTLISGTSPAAEKVELHTMSMDNGVMVMRPLKEIALPKGRTVSLKPGGMHVMLIGLKSQIVAGARTPVTLTVRGPGGKEQKLSVDLEVRQPGAAMGGHMHH